MKQFFALVLATVSTAAWAGVTCTAYYSTQDQSKRNIDQAVDLIPSAGNSDYDRFETKDDFYGKSFSAVVDKENGDVMLFITAAPDYIKGISLNAHPNAQGLVSLSDVDGVTVYRLLCTVK